METLQALQLFVRGDSEDLKGALTTITPDHGCDDGAKRQLSDDAAAPGVEKQQLVDSSRNNIEPDTVPQVDTEQMGNHPLMCPTEGCASPVPDAEDAERSESINNDDHMAAAGLHLASDGSPVSLSLLDASRQHHLLRHSIPTEQRGHGVLEHFGVTSISEASKLIKKMSQRDLQAKFKAVYGARTFSNNNNWLRRKLFEAIGLDPSKGAVKKQGTGSQRRRRPGKPAVTRPSLPRAHAQRRPRGDDLVDHHSIAEALLSLGDAAMMFEEMGDDYTGDEEEEENVVRHNSADNGEGSDGLVPNDSAENIDTRTSWTSELGAARGVPHHDLNSPPEVGTVQLPIAPQLDLDLHASSAAVHQEITANIHQIYEWAACMQRHALEVTGPHQAAAIAAMMGATVNPQIANHPMAMQFAALSGHPAASQMMHSMMQQQMMQQMPSHGVYHRMLQEAMAHQLHPTAAQIQLQTMVQSGVPFGVQK